MSPVADLNTKLLGLSFDKLNLRNSRIVFFFLRQGHKTGAIFERKVRSESEHEEWDWERRLSALRELLF